MRAYLGYPSLGTVPTPVGGDFFTEGILEARLKCVDILRHYNLDYGFLCLIRDGTVEMNSTIRHDGLYCDEILIEGKMAVDAPELFADRWKRMVKPKPR